MKKDIQPIVKKVSLNTPFLGIDNKPILENGQEVNLGKIVGQSIAYSTSNQNAQKLMYIGFQLYNGEDVQLDPQDLKILKDFIEADTQMTNVFKYRVLEQL
ncbi:MULTISPECIES: hypothetical protein [Flectobacillus]|uniref:Uncharacterized protein n=1 Tax=Flectobacillus roseus TaxID=502259 RepID=A0ABT6Y606_9BACT|nr:MULTISPECIES: hypothetical protein [Flectobacillus]NBA78706.1 hypothetical protein [Emticicia sp. ODNR4P]MDI9858961.1 hypothetical protein [Flectobacillus roseus]MDI9862616.1 hypothetical protein [Flectobacillus roseus]MDI9872644.1 hypothetical protein [Flectobacillus roseus]MDI9872761.1 hypothetical protein [Flectobacillus roseus]